MAKNRGAHTPLLNPVLTIQRTLSLIYSVVLQKSLETPCLPYVNNKPGIRNFPFTIRVARRGNQRDLPPRLVLFAWMEQGVCVGEGGGGSAMSHVISTKEDCRPDT